MSDYPELKWLFELSVKLAMKVGVFNNISEDSIHLLKKNKSIAITFMHTVSCIEHS